MKLKIKININIDTLVDDYFWYNNLTPQDFLQKRVLEFLDDTDEIDKKSYKKLYKKFLKAIDKRKKK